jgi:hypothetical protein
MSQVKLRLSYLATSQGLAEDYEVKVLVDGVCIGAAHFYHEIHDDDEDERRVELKVEAKLLLDRAPFGATDFRFLAALIGHLDAEIERRGVDAVETLFGSREDAELPWINPPGWLLESSVPPLFRKAA